MMPTFNLVEDAKEIFIPMEESNIVLKQHYKNKNITQEDIINWYIDFTFRGKKPEFHAIIHSRKEMIKGLARYICVDAKLVDKLIDEYFEER